MWRRELESNPGHIGERRVLKPLRHPCSPALHLFLEFVAIGGWVAFGLATIMVVKSSNPHANLIMFTAAYRLTSPPTVLNCATNMVTYKHSTGPTSSWSRITILRFRQISEPGDNGVVGSGDCVDLGVVLSLCIFFRQYQLRWRGSFWLSDQGCECFHLSSTLSG